jgi:CRP/FNR family cyclic AMP-dependent transcriptional regulator
MKLSPNLLASLQKLRLFQGLSPRQIQRVFASCSQETFEPGATLTESGAESDRMFIVVSGAVEIRSARDLLLAREKAITTVGETGMLSGEVRSATVIVTETVNALVIERLPLLKAMQEDVTLAIPLYRNGMVLVRAKMMAADRRIESLLQAEEEPE